MAVLKKSENTARSLLQEASRFLLSAESIDDYYLAIKKHFLALNACPIDSRYITSMKSGVAASYAKFGNFLYQNKAFEAAKNYYLKSLNYNPEHSYAMYQIGRVYIQQGKFHEAINEFERLLELANGRKYLLTINDKADTWHQIACAARLSNNALKAKEAIITERNLRNKIAVQSLNGANLTLFAKGTRDFTAKRFENNVVSIP